MQKEGSFSNLILLFLTLTAGQLFIHNKLVDLPHQKIRQIYHEQFFQRIQEAPHQYRVMAPLGAGILQKLGVEFRWSYLLWRGLWLTFATWLFYIFLRRYLNQSSAIAAIAILFAILPLTYLQYFAQEADPMNLAIFLIAYLLIEKKRDGLLALLLIPALLNRETALFIPLLWALVRWDEMPFLQCAGWLGAYAAISLSTLATIRAFFGWVPGTESLWYLPFNLTHPMVYLFFLIGFGGFVPPIFSQFSELPKFLQRGILFIPLFLLAHMTTAYLTEIIRYLLPVLPLAITAAFWSWGTKIEKATPEYKSKINLKMSVLYGILMVLSGGGGYAYYRFWIAGHESQSRTPAISDWYLQRGVLYARHGQFENAAVQWQQALNASPSNPTAHYNLALFYLEDYPDLKKARAHLAFLRTLIPGTPVLNDLEKRFQTHSPHHP